MHFHLKNKKVLSFCNQSKRSFDFVSDVSIDLSSRMHLCCLKYFFESPGCNNEFFDLKMFEIRDKPMVERLLSKFDFRKIDLELYCLEYRSLSFLYYCGESHKHQDFSSFLRAPS